MSARIQAAKEEGYTIGIKRMVMPFRVVDDCPNGCGECEYGDDYWPFPVVGKPSQVTLYCHECEKEWPVRLQIDFTAKILPANDRLCRSSAEADGYGTQEQGVTK